MRRDRKCTFDIQSHIFLSKSAERNNVDIIVSDDELDKLVTMANEGIKTYSDEEQVKWLELLWKGLFREEVQVQIIRKGDSKNIEYVVSGSRFKS
jgi:hypothetical protein